MEPLSSLNLDIQNWVTSGTTDVTIDLANYSNTGQIEIVTLPQGLTSLTLNGTVTPTGEASFRIVVPSGMQNVTINLNGVNINSGDNIAIDLRGGSNIVVNFSETNIIASSNSMGIYVSSNQTVQIIGADSTSSLTVNGGLANAAIGNSPVAGLNTGGHIIFSGQGTVTANGGDAADGVYAQSNPINGGFAIGFASNTIGSSSVVINCNILVNANGGDGQPIDASSLTSVAAGKGGAGISLGTNGTLLVQNCPNLTGTSLTVTGGDGGAVAETIPGAGALTNLRAGGNGGSGIQVVSGTVNILGSADVTGGNGTDLADGQLSLPVQGGTGGSAIGFTGTGIATDNIVLTGAVTVTGGNGGDSGVLVAGDGSLVSLNGGNGGDGIGIVSGTISINGITETTGGNGTSHQNADSFGIQGGDGGYAIAFLEPSEQKNHLIIGDDSYLKGGDGGDSGVAVDFSELDLLLIPLDGGRGGNVIEAGRSTLNAVLGSGSYVSGNGGKGGSPTVYGDIKGMSGADTPGAGGSSGSIIHGTEIVDLIKSQDGSFVSGTPGSGGIGVDSSGNKVVGSTGTILKQFDIIERSSIHFGYVNLRTAFIFSEGRSYIKNFLNNYKKYKINIHQTFQNCFNIEQLTVQNNYDLSNPKVLNGSLMILLLITSCITPYEKIPLPVNTESYTDKNRES